PVLAKTPKDIAPIKAPFAMPQLQRPEIAERRFDIRQYGAETMAKTEADSALNTDPIHRAIADAHRAGGGMVVIPKGRWLTGPIHLMSNINLHLEKGAEVVFSSNKEHY